MATIIAKNQTAGALELDQLPVPDNELPASPASVTLTDYASVSEIKSDTQLLGYVTSGDVVLNVDGTDLSTSEGINTLSLVISTSSSSISSTTSTSGGTGNAGKLLELDSNGEMDGLVAGNALSHISDTSSNPHKVTAAQVGAGSGMGFSFHDIDNKAVSYKVEASIIWPGSTTQGSPTKIRVIGYVQSSGTGKIRIYDATNAAVVVELTGITNTSRSILDLGTISNVSSGEAIWEIQLANNGSQKTHVEYLLVEF